MLVMEAVAFSGKDMVAAHARLTLKNSRQKPAKRYICEKIMFSNLRFTNLGQPREPVRSDRNAGYWSCSGPVIGLKFPPSGIRTLARAGPEPTFPFHGIGPGE